MNRTLIAPIALACALFGAANAQATDIVTVGDFADGYKTVDITLSNPNAPISKQQNAGGFVTSVNGGPAVVSYCINLYKDFDLDTTYTDFSLTNTNAFVFANPKASADIGKLFAEGDVVNDSTSQAAMQIAIWEIAYETTGSYDLASGSATFTGAGAQGSGALALATSWLDALASQTSSIPLAVLESEAGSLTAAQDQVLFTPAVPEPSTYALLAGGLMCVGFMARRRAARRA